MALKQTKTMFLPTEEACEDYRMRRFHADYTDISGNESSQGILSDALDRLVSLSENAIGVDIPGLGPPGIENQKMFLAGPQFKNKPQNFIQDTAAQYSQGFYNGPESAWWNSKRKQNQPANEGDELAIARTTNSVWVYAKKNTPYNIKIENETVNGQKVNVTKYDYGGGQSEKDLVVWKMNILPNWNQDDGLEFNHNHEWGKADDIFTQLLSTVGDLAAGANRIVQGIDAIGKSDTSSGNNSPNQARSNIQPDIADTYQKSDRIELTIPFTLFTRNNFYRDILAPIMILNFLSFPKRRKLEEAAAELGALANSVIQGAREQLKTQTPDDNPEPINALGDAEKFLNSVIPGFRVFALEPPSYFNIEHSAGLFSYKNCAVTNFSYKYLGPWITTTNHPQDQSVTGEGESGSSLFRTPKKDFWKFWKTENNILDESWTKTKLTYPIRADCQITFRMIDPLFADDWLSQLKNYQDAWNKAENFNSDDARGKPGSDILSL